MRSSLWLRGGAVAWLALMAFSAAAQTNVQSLADRWVSAYNKHDRAALGAVYTENAHVMTHGRPTVIGRANIEEFWARDFEDRDPLTLLRVTNSVSGTDMMLVHGDYEVINRQDGSRLGGGRFAHIWTRPRNGEWRLDRDLWSEAFEPYANDQLAEGNVQDLADRWVTAYNKHDRAALQALYTDQAALMMHGAPTIGGRADIGAFWAEDFQESNPITLLKVTHALEGVDMILVHGNYEVVDRSDGTKLGLGRFAHIWTGNRSGGWQLDRDLWYERAFGIAAGP